jgi:4-amino-4-deoxy-L-arabinose transferase-like glycosyltransferase
VALIATATSYGWHRDELYFVVAGRHPAWGYPDQPPLTPLIAAALAALGGDDGSLFAVRLGAAAAALVLLMASVLICRDLGGSRRAQGVTALVIAAGPLVLLNGHLLTTTALDVALSATLTWLLIRTVRSRQDRWLLLAGLVTGIGMWDKSSFVVLPAAYVFGLTTVGPRWPLRRPAFWAAAAIALVLAAPNLVWQANNGWPQLEMARRIAAGSSTLDYILLVLACAGLLLIPVTLAGLRVMVAGQLASYRFVAVAWTALVVVYLLAHGKGYYTAGPVPALVAAGAISVDGWLDHGRRTLRRTVLAAGIVMQAALSSVIGLPLIPASALAGTPLPGINGEIASQLGWPALVADVKAAARSIPSPSRPGAVVFTGNYGEAGALVVLGGDGLPPVFSGHNAFSSWGPPRDDAAPVILVGFGDVYAVRFFQGCRIAGVADNAVAVDTEEQGVPIRVCDRPVRPWSQLWGELTHLS